MNQYKILLTGHINYVANSEKEAIVLAENDLSYIHRKYNLGIFTISKIAKNKFKISLSGKLELKMFSEEEAIKIAEKHIEKIHTKFNIKILSISEFKLFNDFHFFDLEEE